MRLPPTAKTVVVDVETANILFMAAKISLGSDNVNAPRMLPRRRFPSKMGSKTR
ncbi:UNVERIFIED_ORG: hypothetical protein GGI63_001388 [Rhizobium esperanzae]|nr:hypothetical protein RHECNPAF_349007 [Rhizobium etli CNPAF512]